MPLHSTTHRLVTRSLAVGSGLALAAAGLVLASGPAQAAPQGPVAGTPCDTGCTLTAMAGTSTLVPGTTPFTVPVWSFTADGTAPTVGVGPTLVVTQKLDTAGKVQPVTITLDDRLPDAGPLSLAIPGMTGLADDTTGITSGTKDYTFTPTRPGTYLYEAGHTPNGARQAAMGLVGAIVVRPEGGAVPADDEAVLVLTDVDPRLNTSTDKTAFDLRSFTNTYRLINGHAYPQTDPVVSGANRTVLLRYVNAGMLPHSMGVLGARETVTAIDAQPADNAPLVADMIAPGTTEDVTVTVPATGGDLPVYDTSGALDTAGRKASGIVTLGGMMTVIQGGASAAPTSTAPLVSAAVSPSPTSGTVTLSGTAVVPTGSTVSAVEYFVDTAGTDGQGTALPVGTGQTSAAFSADIDTSTWATGQHRLVVHAADSSPTPVWSSPVALTVVVDRVGPVASLVTPSLVATNAVSAGVADPNLHVSARFDDTDGGSVVTGAESFVNPAASPVPGSGTAMTPSDGAFNTAGEFAGATVPFSTLNALPADGPVTVAVRGRDAAGNWGALGSTTVLLDRVAPAVGQPTATATAQTVGTKVTLGAAVTDDRSGVVAGEWSSGAAAAAAGTGTAMTLTPNGLNGTLSATVTTLPSGPATLWVRTRDAAGSWSAARSVAVTVPAPDRLLANGFETGNLNGWTLGGQSAGRAVNTTSALQGTYGLQVIAKGTRASFVISSPATQLTGGYHAGFLFNPATLSTGPTTSAANHAQIYSMRNGAGTSRAGVYVRRNGTGGTYQVQLATGTPTTGGWVTFTAGKGTFLVDWNGATVTLTVNGAAAGSVGLSGGNVATSALGLITAGSPSSGSAYLDGFVANRTLSALTQPSLLP